MPRNRDDLDAALLAAHARGDHRALIDLYEQASQWAAQKNNQIAAGFYLTHAYVFALEQGDARAQGLHERLKAVGLEE